MTNAPRTFDTLVVAAGGGGAEGQGGSGTGHAGNGQAVESLAVALTATSHTVTVGGGGSPAPRFSMGGTGGTSSIGGVSATGGGGGQQAPNCGNNYEGCPVNGTSYTPITSHMSGASASYANATVGGPGNHGHDSAVATAGKPGIVIVRYEIAP